MAGPTNQRAVSFNIPPGESQVQYPIALLAREVENFEFTQDETLISVFGPTLYEPVPPNTLAPAYRSENIHSLFHTTLNGGLTDVLIVRWGDALYWHNGWSKTYSKLTTLDDVTTSVPLSDELRPVYPDQYVVLNDRIIFTNGVDRARIITYEGVSFPLGFANYPPTPQALSPIPIGSVSNNSFGSTAGSPADDFLTILANGDRNLARIQQEPNYRGYSWPGKIGSTGATTGGGAGSILAGSWTYRAQYEDFFGNRGPLSAPSNAATISEAYSGPPAVRNQSNLGWFARTVLRFDSFTGSLPTAATNPDEAEFINSPDVDNTSVDDLLKQFVVTLGGGEVPKNVAAVNLYRTEDTKNQGVQHKFLVRLTNASSTSYPDNIPDSGLGEEAQDTIAVPVFRTMCTHQGRLVIANTLSEPGIVRRSEPGFPGTYVRSEFVYPDAGGAEVTAVVSHNGVLLAFTENTVYSLQEFSNPLPLAEGIGCVAPRSISALPNGNLIWLGRDGFYALSPGASIQKVSEPIDRLVEHFLSKGRMRMAVSTYNYQSREYQCAVSEAGSNENNLILCLGEGGWRRKRLGLAIRDICTTRDWRKYSLVASKELPGITKTAEDGTQILPGSDAETNDVYVLDRETNAYVPADRSVRYRSNWFRSESHAMTPSHLRTMYVGMLDAFDGDVTIRFYINGSWAEAVSMSDLKSVAPDDGQGIVSDVAGKAVVGTARTRDPRLFWRQVPIQLRDARLWAFEIETNNRQALHLAAVAFDASVATMGNPNSRVPRRADV